jgi:hypothetical protein
MGCRIERSSTSFLLVSEIPAGMVALLVPFASVRVL